MREELKSSVQEDSYAQAKEELKMKIYFGYCSKCGNTEGPWIWKKKTWICEECYKKEKNKENEENKKKNEELEKKLKEQDEKMKEMRKEIKNMYESMLKLIENSH